MNPMEKIMGKKPSDEPSCGNCSHAIVQDQESGIWYHVSRDTNNACYVFDSKTNIQCKCARATPFKNSQALAQPYREPPKKLETIPYPVRQEPVEPEPLPEEPPAPQPVPQENPVSHILEYLKDYEIAHGVLILQICNKIVLEKVKIE